MFVGMFRSCGKVSFPEATLNRGAVKRIASVGSRAW